MMLRRIARPLLAASVIADGVHAVRHPHQVVRPDSTGENLMRNAAARTGRDVSPATLVRTLGAVKVASGAMLALGILPRVNAGVLAAAHLPTTLLTNPVWTLKGQARKDAAAAVLRESAVLGGLLLATVDTAGKPSLAWRLEQSRDHAAEIKDAVTEAAQDAARTATDAAEKKAAKALAAARKEARKAAATLS
ncbi:DoxX family membrane protein [Serinibacter salmoneus]|uniref:DoxX-like protein n=1 Tax=Serinibacter salmoneus TaxID=556530 RepID=A0A2A9D0V2_9MICO|nr:DoxX family membrane protein [Serinibacter salmoneus]PFG20317.1 DoxX-like protein [Serinibacter salmoneus]